MENGLRHASGPVPPNIPSVTYISFNWYVNISWVSILKMAPFIIAKINTVIVFVEVVNFLPNTNCQNILLLIQLCNSVSFCLE